MWCNVCFEIAIKIYSAMYRTRYQCDLISVLTFFAPFWDALVFILSIFSCISLHFFPSSKCIVPVQQLDVQGRGVTVKKAC